MTTEKSIDEQIEEQVAYSMRTHALRQAHEQIRQARDRMKMAAYQVGEADAYADLIGGINNTIETLMWKIETEVRERNTPR